MMTGAFQHPLYLTIGYLGELRALREVSWRNGHVSHQLETKSEILALMVERRGSPELIVQTVVHLFVEHLGRFQLL